MSISPSHIITGDMTGYGFLTGECIFLIAEILLLNNNTCSISCAVVSEKGTLKLKKEDPQTQTLILPCISSELIIPSRPKFKKGEIVFGKVNLISSDFYDVEEKSEIKYRIELTGYFKRQGISSRGKV